MATKKKKKNSRLSAEGAASLAASRARLAKLVTKAKLDKHADVIASVTRPSIRVLTKKAKKGAPLPTGSSRFGGMPDLPPNEKWPVKDGVSLTFIAQLRCDELAKYDEAGSLPSSGLLSFFVAGSSASDHYGNHGKVYYFDDAAMKTLVSTKPPPGPEREDDPRGVATITYRAELSILPMEGRNENIKVLRKALTQDEMDTYNDNVLIVFAGEPPHHRLLGYSDGNYNYGQKNDELLFQIDSDDASDWNYGDAQNIKMFIAPSALAARDFKKVRTMGDEE